MNQYRFEDLSVGMEDGFTADITEDMMEKFREISGDHNPLHVDADFAREHGFPGRVAYGMLTASLLSKLGGVHIPGERCLIHSVEVKFLNPVYVGDVLDVRGKVTELHDNVRQVVMKVEVKNQRGEKVVRGTMKVGVLE